MNKLTWKDFNDAASFLKCEIRAIKAVAIVESGGRGGFDNQNRVLIRFEGHKFRSFTNGKFDLTHPQVSYRYHKSHRHCGNIHGYTAFNEAMKLDSLAAMKSCSIGMFQPMVFNYHEMGYASPSEMWDDFRKGEREQLLAFCRLIKKWGLDDELRRATLADFTVFARVYNGADFRVNDYHNKMHRYYVNYRPEKNTFQNLQENEISFHLPDQSLSNDSEVELDIPQTDSANDTDAVSLPQTINSDSVSDQVSEVNTVANPAIEPAPISVSKPDTSEPIGDEPIGDEPNAEPKTWLNVEDWKPWVFAKLKWVWAGFTGTNLTQGATTFYTAIQSGENWWIPILIGVLIFIFSLIICAVISAVLLLIWHVNRKEIVHYKTLAQESLINLTSANLGLNIEKIQ